MIEAYLHTWMNVAAILVIAGLAFYLTLFPYMTKD